jgi:hypothetical protein
MTSPIAAAHRRSWPIVAGLAAFLLITGVQSGSPNRHAGPARAAEVVDLVPVAQLGGPVSAAAMSGDRAYLAQAGRLLVADYRPPAPFTVLGRSAELGAEALVAVAVSGTTAYLAAEADGLIVVDVADPAAPRELGRYRPTRGESVVGVTVVGDTAWLPAASGRLLVVDVANPARPVAVAGVDLPGFEPDRVLGIAAVGPHLWLARPTNGLTVLDASDPANPRVVARFEALRSTGVAAVGPHLAVAASDGLAVLDVSRPDQPFELASLKVADPFALAFAGRYAWLSVPHGQVWAIDVQDPARPRLAGIHPLAGFDAEWAATATLAAADGRLLVLDADGGVRGAQVGDPAGLAVLGVAPQLGRIHRVAAHGDVGVLVDDAGVLRVQDLSVPAWPRERSRARLPWRAERAFVGGKLAVAGGVGGGLALVDLSDPDQPRLQGTLSVPWAPNDIGFGDGYLFIAAGPVGLIVVDIKDLARPRLLSMPRLATGAIGVALAPGFAHVSVADRVLVLDVADPGAPKQVAEYGTGGIEGLRSVGLSGNRALVVDGWLGTLYDVTQPRSPRSLGVVWQPAAGRGIQGFQAYLDGSTAVVMTADGLFVLDVAEPAAARETGHYDAPLEFLTPNSIAVANHHAYLTRFDRAFEQNRLEIVALRDADPSGRLWGRYEGSWSQSQLALHQGYAYVLANLGSDSGLRAFDLRDPGRPTPRGGTEVGRPISGIAQLGGLLLVAAGDDGLVLVDISKPGAATEAGTWSPGWPVEGVVAADGKALAWGIPPVPVDEPQRTTLTLLDLGNPARPTPLGSFQIDHWPYALTLAGGLVYLNGDGSGLDIWDVRDPAHATRLQTVPTGAELESSALWNGYAYLLDLDNVLTVVDVRNPASATIVKSSLLPGDFRRLYAMPGGSLWILGETGAQLVDLADPAAPRPMAWLASEGAWDIAVQGNLGVLVSRSAGLQTLDLAAARAELPWRRLPVFSRVGGLATRGSLALVAAGEQGLLTLDLADPSRPRVLGALTDAPAEDVALAGDLAYVAAGPAGLRVVSVAQPAAPSLLDALPAVGDARQVALAGGRAVLRVAPGGVRVVDLAQPAAPRLLGGTDLEARRLALVGGGALGLVADGAGDLQLLDLANPAAIVGRSLTLGGEVTDVVAEDRQAWAQVEGQGLVAVDFGDLAAPRAGARRTTWSGDRRLDLAGDRLFSALADALVELDVSDPGNPTLVARAESLLGPSASGRITVQQPLDAAHLLVGTAADGLWVLAPAPAGPTPSPTPSPTPPDLTPPPPTDRLFLPVCWGGGLP